MADESEPSAQLNKIAPGSSELAPFIYWDGVATYGLNNGIVQIELASNVIVPEGARVKVDVLITAHLRCSRAAAIVLRDAIDKALAMQERPQRVIEPVHGSKPN